MLRLFYTLVFIDPWSNVILKVKANNEKKMYLHRPHTTVISKFGETPNVLTSKGIRNMYSLIDLQIYT